MLNELKQIKLTIQHAEKVNHCKKKMYDKKDHHCGRQICGIEPCKESLEQQAF